MGKKKTSTQAAKDEGKEPNVAIDSGDLKPDGDELESMTTTEGRSGVPDWVEIPDDLVFPVGVPVGILLFRQGWTMTPYKGDRHCIVWPLTGLDEAAAYARIRDNFGHAMNELAKQQIRAFDGIKVNWGAGRGKPGNVDDFLDDVGPKCRALLARWYQRTHQLDADEVAHFLEECAIVRTLR